jgi:tRNA(fMet)-specific endonuclease VapC
VKYVLDTNAVSALMRGEPRFVARLRQVSKADVSVPHPVLAEIAYGIARLPRSRRRELLRERFDLVRAELPRAAWSDAVSEAFGTLKALLEKRGERLEDFDVAVAAHALTTDAVLVTANVDHLRRVPGVRIADWGSG